MSTADRRRRVVQQVIRERERFRGQTPEPLPGGGLRPHFPAVPRPELVYWVMSYCGHLVVREPPDLVVEIRHAGERIVAQHPATGILPHAPPRRAHT